MSREPLIIISAGRRSGGKSTTTLKILDQSIVGNPAKGVPPRRALIFDVNGEYEYFKYYDTYRRIPSIQLSEIGEFSVRNVVEIRRIKPYWDDGKRMTLEDMGSALQIIIDSFWGGILLVEDINRYTHDNMKGDLIGSLATIRHRSCDLIIHVQGVGRAANPKLIQNINEIRLHKTTDSVVRHKDKFEDHFPILQLAENIVNLKFDAGDIYYYLYVSLYDNKIRGIFSESDIDKAIEEYIASNYNHLMRPLLNRFNMSGEKAFTPKTAMQHLAGNLKKTYF